MNRNAHITLPDRFDVLKRKADSHMSEIIDPVDHALDHLDALVVDMNASGRGAMLILRGDSGSGKSTFIHTVGLFRESVETVSIPKTEDVSAALERLTKTSAPLRVVVLEGREALTDVSLEMLEKAVHAINSFVRTEAGENTLVAWTVNTDDLANRLAKLADAIGAEALTGLMGPIYRFSGPGKARFLSITNNTLARLNQGQSIHDLGISDDRANDLLQKSSTIGGFLASVRQDLTANEGKIRALVKKERCRVWCVVIAGNDPDNDVDAVTRGTMYSADIDRLLSVTNANIVADLKKQPERLGLLGTFFDARVLHLPVHTALAATRSFADEALKKQMTAAGMSTVADLDVVERFSETNLARSFSETPIRARRVGGKIGSNTVASFEKLSAIAATNDSLLNKAVAECLKTAGLCTTYKLEQTFGEGMTRRTDILAETSAGPIRLEMMWRRKTGRAEIANYVLTKLYNYGRAIKYLD